MCSTTDLLFCDDYLTLPLESRRALVLKVETINTRTGKESAEMAASEIFEFSEFVPDWDE